MAKKISELTNVNVNQLNDDDLFELATKNSLSPTGFDSVSVSINELRKKLSANSGSHRIDVAVDTTINNFTTSFQISIPKTFITWHEDITGKRITNMLAKFNITGNIDAPGVYSGFVFADPTVALHASISQRYTKYRSGYMLGTTQDNNILNLGTPPPPPISAIPEDSTLYIESVSESDDYLIFILKLFPNKEDLPPSPLRLTLNGYIDIAAQYDDAPSYLSIRTVPSGSLIVKGFDVDTVIEWGDGFTTTVTDSAQHYSHYYDNNEYTAKVIPFTLLAPFGESLLISGEFNEILDWGSYSFPRQISFSSEYLHTVPTVEPPTTSYRYLFTGSKNISSNINGWNTSTVTDMTGMFFNCYEFNQSLDNWDVSNVTNFTEMFAACLAFNQPLNNWNTSSAIHLSGMFSGCINFNQPLDNWNVSNVLTIGEMFSGCTNFNQPLNNWDVGNVVNMLGTFSACANFNQPLNNWSVANVTNMDSMFTSAFTFDQDLSGWCVYNIPAEPSFFSIDSPLQEQHKPVWGTCFGDDSLKFRSNDFFISLGGFPVGSLIEMANGTSEIVSSSTESMYIFPGEGVNRIYLANSNPYAEFPFIAGFGLEEILDWGNFAGTSIAFVGSALLVKVPNYIPPTITNMRNMFANTSSFNQDISMWDVSNVTNMDGMFTTALNFDQDLSSWCVPLITSEPADFSFDSPLQEQHKPVWGTCPGDSTMKFKAGNGVVGVHYFPVGTLVEWGDSTSSVVVNSPTGVTKTYPAGTFQGKIHINHDNPYTNLSATLYGDGLLEVNDFGDFDHSGISFAPSPNLVQVPLHLPASITIASTMFNGCTLFNSHHVVNWDVSNITLMNSMFNNTPSFNQDLSGWCVSNILTEPASFASYSALTSEHKPVWGAPCA